METTLVKGYSRRLLSQGKEVIYAAHPDGTTWSRVANFNRPNALWYRHTTLPDDAEFIGNYECPPQIA